MTPADPPASQPDDEPLWRTLPAPPADAWSNPANYVIDAPLWHAVTTAIRLGQPLLLTGEPGCGKTELANHLALKLGTSIPRGVDETGRPLFEHALRFDVKSDTRARDLFYSIDMVERFHAGRQDGSSSGDLNPLNFIRFNALGRALLYAREPDSLTARLLPWQRHPGPPQRSVVLIDEIDKAPSDLPNDLLMEIEKMRFYIAELSLTVDAPAAMRPILVITSNTERPLPDAFLRRCAYFHIPFPPADRLRKILAERMGAPETAPLLADAVAAFEALRSLPLRKKPATAELLGFVQGLRGSGFGLDDRLTDPTAWQPIARVTLLKTREDQSRPLPSAISPGG